MTRNEIADQLFTLANALSGNETGHLAGIIHIVVGELWEMEQVEKQSFPCPCIADKLNKTMAKITIMAAKLDVLKPKPQVSSELDTDPFDSDNGW